MIDFALHYVKRAGNRTARVFKLRTVDLGPRASVSISKTHNLRKITTRTHYSGRHALEILINGKSRAIAEFGLEV